VPQSIPETPDFPPRDLWTEFGGKIAQLGGSFADRQQRNLAARIVCSAAAKA